ncbi:MAG: aminoacetone oxidase family FAD-binding enzyme, partial [Symbiobacteriaceae bacterium]|nr:aminoacetone oxidase family FAD-binding enzyme [Symbiobacteriaceae bacterium]
MGGGAAGLLAAYSAASLGAQVHLLEKGDRLGHKLSLTGKGRCNLTNDCSVAQLVQNIPGNGRFLYSAFAVFDSQACQSFFTEIGVPLKVERGGRVFPQSDSATQVVAALTRLLNHHRVQVHYRSPVSHLLFDNTSGDMPTVVGVATPKGEHRGDAIILATGGASYPLTGSRGDGYTLAATAGHTIIPVRGALVPLEMVEKWVPLLQGLSLRNV